MNVIVVDNQNSKDIITALLKTIEGINVVACFDNLNEIEDTKNIDIIFFDIDKKSSKETLKKVVQLSKLNHRLNFVATSYEINSELVVEILKTQGVKEFLLKPVIKPILVNAVKKIEDKINNVLAKKADTIAIYSSNTAGKTSLATNAAYEIATLTKEKTCLLDLNYGECLSFLNLIPKYNNDYIINNIEKSDENFLFSQLNQFDQNPLYVFCPNDDITKTYSKDTLNKIINCLKTFFKYIIIDMPPNIDEKTASLLLNADMTLVMCNYNFVNLKNCKLTLDFLNNIGYDKNKVNLVINRYTKNSTLTIKDVEETLNKNVFYKIPNNYITLNDAIERGLPLQITNPNSNIYKAYKTLAKEIINTDFEDLRQNCANKSFGIFNLIRRMGE